MIFPREAVDPLYVEVVKARLEGVLRTFVVEGVPAHGRELELHGIKGPFQHMG